MKENAKKIMVMLLAGMLVTGCGCSKNNNSTESENGDNQNVPQYDEDDTVVKDQIFTGLEFVNIGLANGEITTAVINNTGVPYEGSAFTITVKDEQENVIVELTDRINETIPSGSTKTVSTPTTADLTNAYSIEYSIVTE